MSYTAREAARAVVHRVGDEGDPEGDDGLAAAVLARTREVLSAAFGAQARSASITFIGLEPIEILRFRSDQLTTYVTLGMSRRPMTSADSLNVDPDGPRAELMLQLAADSDDVWRQLAVLAAAPNVEGLVYREDATVDLGVPLASGSRCVGGLVALSALPPIATPGGPVRVLRLLPATATELAWCRVHGAESLRRRWSDQAVDLLDLARPAAVLE